MDFNQIFSYVDWQLFIDQLRYDPAQPLIFSSGLFLFLFLGFSFVYMLLRRQDAARILFVTLFSYYFYYKSSGTYFFLLAIVTVSDWVLGHYIGSWVKRGDHWKRKARWLVGLSIVIDMSLLAYFKYTNFFFGSLAEIVGANFQPWDIFLPVGISFFTFQSLSYTIDIYRGEVTPLNRLLDYAFFVSFFPQLVAGPIVKARDFVPQIRKPLCVTNRMFAQGFYLVLIGIFKKAVISDYISLNFVDRIFDNPSLYSGIENLLGLYGYALQIYCDFSGYSDMAIGLALLLGFRFPQNFNVPYTSASPTEFWRRWHISLSTWIRDYIYISMGGSRKGKFRTYVNLFLTMLICGLWHGAALNFILWGALHGFALACHKFFSQQVLHHDRHYRSTGWKRVVAVFLTFHFVVFAWMLFRLDELEPMNAMINQIVYDFNPQLFWSIVTSYWTVFLLVAIGYITHWLPQPLERRIIMALTRCNVLVYALLLTALIYFVIQVRSSDVQPFIYFQF